MVILHEGDGLTISTQWSGDDLLITTSDERDISIAREYTLVVPADQMRRLSIALGVTGGKESVERGLRAQRSAIVSVGVRAWLGRRMISTRAIG